MLSLVYYLFSFVIFIIFFLLARRRWRNPQLHGPHYIPLIGQLRILLLSKFKILGMTVGDNTVGLLQNCLKYPRIFLNKSLMLDVYIVHDLKLVREMTIERANEFINRPSFGYQDPILVSRSIVSAQDEEWKARRKVVSPHFNSAKIAPIIDRIFFLEAKILVDQIGKYKDNEQFDMQECFTKLTMDIIGKAAFGVEFGTQTDTDSTTASAVINWVDAVVKVGAFFLVPLWNKVPFQMVKKLKKNQMILEGLFNRIINERKKNPDSGNHDLLEALLESGLPPRDLLAETLLLFIGGHETTSNALTWSVYCIARHPEVEKKIVEEIENEIGLDKKIDSTNLYKLKYIESVIKEVLRMYPPTIITTRENTNPVFFDGHLYPARSQFVIPIWAMQHNEENYPNPEVFNPARFEDQTKNHNLTFMAFGAGPRMCLGMQFALTEAKTALASLYQKYTFIFDQPSAVVLEDGNLLKPETLMVTRKIRTKINK